MPGVGIARPRALDRPRLDPPALGIEGQEQLGRVGHQHPVAHAPEGAIGRRARRQPDEHVERIGARLRARRARPARYWPGTVRPPRSAPPRRRPPRCSHARVAPARSVRAGAAPGGTATAPASQSTARSAASPASASSLAQTDGRDRARLMIEHEHGRIAGQGQVRPVAGRRPPIPGRDPRPGVIGRQPDHEPVQAFAGQRRERPPRLHPQRLDPVRLAGDIGPPPVRPAVGQQAQRALALPPDPRRPPAAGSSPAS